MSKKVSTSFLSNRYDVVAIAAGNSRNNMINSRQTVTFEIRNMIVHFCLRL